MTTGTITESTTSPPAERSGSSVIPALRYADADAAVRWLADAFGFAQHHRRAVAAGADADPIRGTEYGSRKYAMRDLEGNSWHVGTYDPWSA